MHEVRDTFGAHTPWQALELEFQHLGSRTAPEPRWRALSGWVYRCVEGSGDKVQKERPRPSASPQEQGPTLSLPVCSTPNKKPQRSPDAWVHLTSSSGSSSGQNCSWSLVLLLPRRLHVNRWQSHPTTCWAHICRCYPWHFLALSITNLLASLSPLPSNILSLPTSPAFLCLHLTQPSNLPPGPAQSPPSRSLAHLHCLLPSNLSYLKQTPQRVLMSTWVRPQPSSAYKPPGGKNPSPTPGPAWATSSPPWPLLPLSPSLTLLQPHKPLYCFFTMPAMAHSFCTSWPFAWNPLSLDNHLLFHSQELAWREWEWDKLAGD